MSRATLGVTAKYTMITAVVKRCREVRSRLKVHKIFYILKSLGYPVVERFEYRQYGPYSDDLATDLQSTVNADHVRERMVESAEDEDEERYRRYDYSLGQGGGSYVEREFSLDPMLEAVTGGMANVAEELNRCTPLQLELIATLMFLQDENVRPNHIVAVLKSSKPQYTDAGVHGALEFIRDLRGRASFATPPDFPSIFGLVSEGPPSDAAGGLDEEIYGGT